MSAHTRQDHCNTCLTPCPFAGIELLKQFANVDTSYNLTPEELEAKVSLVDALIVRSATKVRAHAPLLLPPFTLSHPHAFNAALNDARRPGHGIGAAGNTAMRVGVFAWRAQVTRKVFEASKGRLKVVGRAGVGIDNVDLTAATEVSSKTLNHTHTAQRLDIS